MSGSYVSQCKLCFLHFVTSIKKMGTNFLVGPVAIGQGVIVLNWKRVDLD